MVSLALFKVFIASRFSEASAYTVSLSRTLIKLCVAWVKIVKSNYEISRFSIFSQPIGNFLDFIKEFTFLAEGVKA